MTTVLHDRTARHSSDAYRTKELSPVEVTRAVLLRIDSCGPIFHCRRSSRLAKQLGLKLETGAVPLEMIVIDHVEHST